MRIDDDVRKSLPALLRELAPSVHPRRGELFAAVARALEDRDAKRQRHLFLIASGQRAPAQLRRDEDYSDTQWSSYDDENRAKKSLNRSVAMRLLETATTLRDEPQARLARSLAFSFCERGLATFHLLRFACGLPACFGHHFADGGLAEVYGPVLGPLVESREELARYLVEIMNAETFEATDLASVAWHGTRRVPLFPALSENDMVDRLDALLTKSALDSDPRKGAARVLVALGLSRADAGGLVALAPREKVTDAGLPAFVVVVPAGRGQRVALEAERGDEREDDGVVRDALPVQGGRFDDPWLRRIARLTPEAAGRALAKRWSDVPAWLEKVRKPLVGGTVIGMAHGAAGSFLEVRLKGSAATRYVPGPTTASFARKKLKTLGLDDAHLLEHVLAFDGLHDSDPGMAGGFYPVADFVTVERARKRTSSVMSTDMIESDELKGWRDAVIVYEDGTGDVLLVSPSGPIAWVRHGEGVVERCGKSFKDFIARDGSVKNYSWSSAHRE